MIITVTLNPAMDKTLVLRKVTMGDVNRVSTSRNDIGGKGINVSKVLNKLGKPTKAMGFLGGPLEEVFRKELLLAGIEDNFQSIRGTTRMNIKIVDNDTKICTDFNEPGPEITEEELRSFYERFEELVKKEDLVVLSGGLPRNIPQEIYGILTKIAQRIGAKVLVDAEGEALKHAIEAMPFMVKPNERELAAYCGKEVLSLDEILEEGSKILGKGISMVLVSRGSEGSILFTSKVIYLAEGLLVPVQSTVGAGDAMMAAFAYGIAERLPIKLIAALAQASGVAAVMKEGTMAASKEEIEAHVEEALRNIEEWK